MANNVTNKEILEAIQGRGNDGASPSSGLFKRMGEVEQLQAKHGATLSTLVDVVNGLGTKIDSIVEKRETKLTPIITVTIGAATLVLGLVIAIGSLALYPIRAEQGRNVEWNRRMSDRVHSHVEKDGHPTMIERVNNLINSHTKLDEILQREMRQLDDALSQESESRHLQQQSEIANLKRTFQREMELQIKPIQEQLKTLDAEQRARLRHTSSGDTK